MSGGQNRTGLQRWLTPVIPEACPRYRSYQGLLRRPRDRLVSLATSHRDDNVVVRGGNDGHNGAHRSQAARARAGWGLRRALAACADIIVPPCCLVCRTPLGAAPRAVRALLARGALHSRAAVRCAGHPPALRYGRAHGLRRQPWPRPPAYDRARAVAHFSGAMRTLVHQFKYADRHDARALFGRWLAEAGRELLAGVDVVVPVPLTRWRLLSRRFNQAAILAQELSRQTGLRLDPHLLHRTRFTKTQVGLTHDQRQAQRGRRLQRGHATGEPRCRAATCCSSTT